MPRKNPPEQPGNLLTATRTMLCNRNVQLTLNTIATDTGLPYGWLLMITLDADCRPAVHRIEKLYVYLCEKCGVPCGLSM
jgi:hypothetical protein